MVNDKAKVFLQQRLHHPLQLAGPGLLGRLRNHIVPRGIEPFGLPDQTVVADIVAHWINIRGVYPVMASRVPERLMDASST
jgi:hypothetical protein